MSAGLTRFGDVGTTDPAATLPGGFDGGDPGGAEADEGSFGARPDPFGDEEDRPGDPVTDGSGVVHVTTPTEGREERVVELRGTLEIRNFKNNVM